MSQIGVRGLENTINAILHAIARLVATDKRQDEDIWAELHHLCDEIAANWRSEGSAVELVREGRR